MKISKKLKEKRIKRVFNLYNLGILKCIVIITICLFIIFKPKKKMTVDGIEIVQTDVKEGETLDENDAKKIAVKQFKKLGESDVKESDINVKRIVRKEDEYYFITSKLNTMEIRIKDGEIVRINSAYVQLKE